MFERFSVKAREAVVGAQEEARARGATAVGSEHILASLVRVPDTLVQAVLTGFSVTPDDVRAGVDRLSAGPSDAEALASIGIDLDEVRSRIEEAFGPGALDRTRSGRTSGMFGHIRMDKAAKKVLELALRESIALKHGHIGAEHLLLGMLHDKRSGAGRVLADLGITQAPTRTIVDELVRGRRAS